MAHGIPATHPEEKNALNWSPKISSVERKGGLPDYVRAIAVALVRGGMTRDRAIATAVNSVKKTCATGHWGGDPQKPISTAIRAAACDAVKSWEAKKVANLAAKSAPGSIRLTSVGRAVARATRFQRIYSKLVDRGLAEQHATALARAAAERST